MTMNTGHDASEFVREKNIFLLIKKSQFSTKSRDFFFGGKKTPFPLRSSSVGAGCQMSVRSGAG